MHHLEDLTLFSYLDGELDGRVIAETRAHLADCAACQTRLTTLQTMFSEVEALPDLPLTRDLAGAVVAQIKLQQRPVTAPRLSPVAGWALGLQALLALVGLGMAVPLVAEFIQVPSALFNWQAVLGQSQSLFTTNFSINWTSMLAGLKTFVESNQVSIQLPTVSLAIMLPLLIAVTGLWLVGNGVLLRQTGRLQRR
jgi:Putative zinc-finger